MSGHTPGPWRWSPHYKTMDGRATWTLLGGDGYGILSCDGEENSPQGLNDVLNADLIAAAPDSHEANVKTVEAFNELFGISKKWTDEQIYDELPSSGLAIAYFAARDAIAKATQP